MAGGSGSGEDYEDEFEDEEAVAVDPSRNSDGVATTEMKDPLLQLEGESPAEFKARTGKFLWEVKYTTTTTSIYTLYIYNHRHYLPPSI